MFVTRVMLLGRVPTLVKASLEGAKTVNPGVASNMATTPGEIACRAVPNVVKLLAAMAVEILGGIVKSVGMTST